MGKQLTKNFNEDEFRCPCCGKGMISLKLVIELQKVRNLINFPITITSGYRCKKYNNEVGGTANSYHVQGLAADIKTSGHPWKGFTLQEQQISLYRYLEIAGDFDGIGTYPETGIIHVDCGYRYNRWVRRNGIYTYLF